MFTNWLRMWVRPRETIRSIVKDDPRAQFKALSVVYGFPMLLNMAQNFSLGTSVHPLVILLFAVILSLPIGMLALTVLSWVLHYTGKWIGGKSTFINMRAAVSWANVTNVATSIIWLALMAYFGSAVFMKGFATTPFAGGDKAFAVTLFFLQLVISIWALVIFLKSVGEVQGFSAWKALLNVIIPLIIFVVLVWILMFIPAMFRS